MTSTACPTCGVELPPDSPGGVCPNCLLENALNSNVAVLDRAPFAATSPGPGRVAPPDVGQIQPLFPQLELECLVGQGGMGAVYKARQKKLDRAVALKLIRGETAADPTFAERFMREARTLARLNHPHIVAVHDFGEVSQDDSASPETLYFFVMEYVDGANLRQLMQDGALDGNLALSIVRQVCDALQYAHDEGIVHRDIKPENILIDARGRVKIADFGLAKLAQPTGDHFTLTGTHQVMGTPRYMAPEQMAGSRTVDHRADIYSLGVVFYEMLTGQIPAGHFEPPSRHSSVGPGVDEIVLKSLASDPDQRFQAVSELREQVDEISGTATASSQYLASGMSDEQPGWSTIIDREAAAAWNLLGAGVSAKPAAAVAPQLPSLLILLVCVCGGVAAFLPWSEVTLSAPPAGTAAAAEVHAPAEASYMFCQDWQAPQVSAEATDSVDRRMIVRPGESLMFHGIDHWPGFVTSILCGVLTLLAIVVPRRYQPAFPFVFMFTGVALAMVIIAILYRPAVESMQVRLVAERGLESAATTSITNEYQLCMFQDMDAQSAAVLQTLGAVPHSFRYQWGFHIALASAVVLLVINVLGIRQSVIDIVTRSQAAAKRRAAENAKHSTRDSETRSGRNLTSVRFRTNRVDDLQRLIQFHFEGLGYRLTDSQSTQWTFRRGGRWGGLWSFDIREFETTLTVRTVPISDDSVVVSCNWHVATMGGIVSGCSMRKLEREARELEGILHPEREQNKPKKMFGWDSLNGLIEGAVSLAEVAESTKSREQDAGEAGEADKTSRQPRFSVRAIIAACIAPVGLISLALAVLLPVGVSRMENASWIATTAPVLQFGIIALLSGSATTILGFMALSDIKASAGQLRGLGLAFCDAVLFPCLLLLGTVGGLTAVTILLGDNFNGAAVAAITGVAVLIALGLLLAVLDQLWRKTVSEAESIASAAADSKTSKVS
jgi:tRNA A-37 threonylcarbamoyl transferase component Bud32